MRNKPSRNQLEIIRHALGMNRSAKPYRNVFVTGPECDGWLDCIFLERAGYMCRVTTPGFVAEGDVVFCVTAKGRALVEQRQEVVHG